MSHFLPSSSHSRVGDGVDVRPYLSVNFRRVAVRLPHVCCLRRHEPADRVFVYQCRVTSIRGGGGRERGRAPSPDPLLECPAAAPSHITSVWNFEQPMESCRVLIDM